MGHGQALLEQLCRAHGEPLQEAFLHACRQHNIRGRAIDGDGFPGVWFEGQENADSQLMLQAFCDELEKALVDPDSASDCERAVRHGIGRLRTLLIEHNSYISGGLAFPFHGVDESVRSRGLAIYRYPAAGEVDVVAGSDHVSIQFAPGELGQVTSSGFYVPTLFQGDVVVTLDYQIDQWQPNENDAACLALFAQNQPSTARYYAQRMSAGDLPHVLLANLCDNLGPEHPAAEPAGSLRIRRTGSGLQCLHRHHRDDEWLLLGEASEACPDDLILGAKIWSKIDCEGLAARLYNLEIVGEMAQEQIPMVPVLPDPRHRRSDPTSQP